MAEGRTITEIDQSPARLAAQMAALVEASPLAIVWTDPTGQCVDINDTYAKWSGLDSLTARGSGWLTAVHADDRPRVWSQWNTAMTAGGEFSGRLRVVTATGEARWIAARAAAVRMDDKVIGHVVTMADITEQVDATHRLRVAEDRYALAERGSNDGLWDWNLNTNVLYLSPRAKSLLGYEPDERVEDPNSWFDRVVAGDNVQLQADLTFHMAGHTQQLRTEHRVERPDGTTLWLLCRGVGVRDKSGAVTRMAGSLSDITRQKEAEERLRTATQTDKLTGLPNRTVLHERVTQALKRVKANPAYKFALLFLDFDRFKLINDSLGHEAGDALLIEISARLRRCLRGQDTVTTRAKDQMVAARLGGDEFVILLEDLKQFEDANVVSQRLLKNLSEPYHIHGREVTSSVSIGIASSQTPYATADEVIRDADTAMYQAKTNGKACQVVFDPKMHEGVKSRLELEGDLRKAVERQEFYLEYQPIVSLESGALKGFESLIRWRHPTRGVVSPGEFIPVAEETDLIIPIGAWAAREACRQLGVWQRQYGLADRLSMNVNLSRNQLVQPDLVETIRAAINDAGVDPQTVRLEITESAVMRDTKAATEMLNRLKTLKIRLDMDDFGTGYSSLSCFHRFPLDGLKIDRAFILNMSDRADYAAVVQAIISLGRSLGIRVTAEGVETADQVAQLQALECENAQGYYFAKPMGVKVAEDYLVRSFHLAKSA